MKKFYTGIISHRMNQLGQRTLHKREKHPSVPSGKVGRSICRPREYSHLNTDLSVRPSSQTSAVTCVSFRFKKAPRCSHISPFALR